MRPNSKILLVVNPISGNISKDGIIQKIKEALSIRKCHQHQYTTTGTSDNEKLQKLLISYNPDRIICVGGDGTLKMIAEVLGSHTIPVGIIPAGSANGMAVALGIYGDLDDNIRTSLSDHMLRVDKLLINGAICMHIADLGINAELIRNYESSGIRGSFGYLLQSFPTLFTSEYPFSFRIKTDSEVLEKEGIMLAIANAQKYGTGAKINPTGRIDDSKFEVIIFKSLDIIEILKTLKEEVSFTEDFAESYTTTKVEITSQRGIPFQIDGEYQGLHKQVVATMSEEKLLIPVPFTP